MVQIMPSNVDIKSIFNSFTLTIILFIMNNPNAADIQKNDNAMEPRDIETFKEEK